MKQICKQCGMDIKKNKRGLFIPNLCMKCLRRKQEKNPFLWTMIDKLNLTVTALFVCVLMGGTGVICKIVLEDVLPPATSLAIVLSGIALLAYSELKKTH